MKEKHQANYHLFPNLHAFHDLPGQWKPQVHILLRMALIIPDNIC